MSLPWELSDECTSYKKQKSVNNMSSARAPLVEGEVDPKGRATKKVKPRSVDGTVSEVVKDVEPPVSFKEALLNEGGGESDDGVEFEDWNDEDLPENRWYKEVEEPMEMAVGEKTTGGIPEIMVSDKEIAEWSKEWEKTLVVNVLGKKVNYKMMESKAKRDWARRGGVKVIDMPRGFFAVHFEADEDYKHALFEGPWMVADHYLLVQRWRPNFLSSAKNESRVAVWVRIPELPLELYNKTFLERVGKALGSFLRMDHLTCIQSRGRFARFCAEIDLAKPLTPVVMFRGEKIKLEFEGLHAVCFKCGVYGHRSETCYVHKPELQTPVHAPVEELQKVVELGQKGDVDRDGSKSVSKEKSSSVAESTMVDGDKGTNPEEGGEEGSYGPWMLVKRNKKNKGQMHYDPNARKAHDGNWPISNHRPGAERANGPSQVRVYKDKGKKVKGNEDGEQSRVNKDPPNGPSGGPPLVIYEDQSMAMDARTSSSTVIVKRPNGGKSPIGPKGEGLQKSC